MDLAPSMTRPPLPMALGHHSANTDYTDAQLDRLSPACAISHDDFGTKPEEETKKIN